MGRQSGAEGFLLSFCIAKRKKQRKGSLRKEFRLLRKAAGALPLDPATL